MLQFHAGFSSAFPVNECRAHPADRFESRAPLLFGKSKRGQGNFSQNMFGMIRIFIKKQIRGN